MEWINETLGETFIYVPIKNWIYFFVTLILAFVTQKTFIFILRKRVLKFARNTSSRLDELFLEALIRPLNLGLLITGIYIALQFLNLPEKVGGFDLGKIQKSIWSLLITFTVTWFLLRTINILKYYLEKVTAKTDTKLDDQLVPIVVRALKIVIITVAILIVFQNMGYSVTSILASLGIGGLALAMASKDTVENFFGSIIVFSDKPFQLDDWVKINDVEGTVEEVGFRSTRIRQFDNALVHLPNSTLTRAPIINFSRRFKRRISFTLGVAYSTPPDKIEQAVERIREMIANDKRFNQDFYLVNFNQMADFSLGIFIYCFTDTTVWADYLQIQQDFLLSILKMTHEMGVEIAFPTQTIYTRPETPLPDGGWGPKK